MVAISMTSRQYPRVVTNSDGAGVVDEVGPGVPERWLGKRVWLYNRRKMIEHVRGHKCGGGDARGLVRPAGNG
jgi:NADPH:quinone reductase-like Zn-dependent oxidoreductase